VSAYKNGKNISISLIEGTVKVSRNESNQERPIVILHPDQQLVYNTEANASTVEQFDKDKTIGWKNNILKFDNEAFEEVLTRLEREYGISFELKADSYKDFKVTANFKNESSQTVTEVLQKLTGLGVNTIKDNNEVKKIIFEEK
jgi:transmembrane sensor